jgi:hypothetical protein
MKKLKSQHHVSEERIEANRANARKSTGPKSVERKLIFKQNATKHGLLAKEILLASETSEESRAEYKQLLEDLQQRGSSPATHKRPPHARVVEAIFPWLGQLVGLKC